MLSAVSPRPHNPSTQRPRVLIADDYPGIVSAIGRLLAPDCDVVGSVADGSELLEAVERLQPDVVVLDLNMPKVNGLDACLQIRQAIPHTKVIMLTATIDEGIMQKALALGASAFIAKQSVGDDLLSAIRRAWEEH
jgi:DNA-binding NarL/FixJ family response regulator